MHSKYIGLGCADNPARVADYGAMPWESDIEPETVSEKAATGGAPFALSKGEGAFGYSLKGNEYPKTRHLLKPYETP